MNPIMKIAAGVAIGISLAASARAFSVVSMDFEARAASNATHVVQASSKLIKKQLKRKISAHRSYRVDSPGMSLSLPKKRSMMLRMR